ncbi:MAG: DUF424 family protein [Candidatus Heimdallarchaeota archaeon]|nr:DUF424 family protein [Candidatus Heimdallarchaeota archaeon]
MNDSQPSKKVSFKVHQKDKTEILAICDKELFGKRLRGEKAGMIVPSEFYDGEEIPTEDALQLMKRYQNVNALGSVLELAIQKRLFNEEAVLWFKTEEGKKIPHLLIFSIPPI